MYHGLYWRCFVVNLGQCCSLCCDVIPTPNKTGGGDKPASGASAGSKETGKDDAERTTATTDKDDDEDEAKTKSDGKEDTAGERGSGEGSDDNQVSIILNVHIHDQVLYSSVDTRRNPPTARNVGARHRGSLDIYIPPRSSILALFGRRLCSFLGRRRTFSSTAMRRLGVPVHVR